jgi:hypothetical protein
MENQEKKTNSTNYEGEIQNFKMPKNLRQIGNTSSSSKVIYVEDYVMSYAKQLAEKENSGCTIAILLGYYIRTETNKNIFVKGAIEMETFNSSNGIFLSDEGWTSVYENIKKYFLDVEIVGWALIGTEFYLESEENLRKIHSENFNGTDKILMKVNTLEKEENFYRFEQTSFAKQDGYYIYYERNEEMQNYMVDVSNGVSEEINYSDTTTSRIRELISDKRLSKTQKDKKENEVVVGNVEQKSFLERFSSRERTENKEGKDVTRLLYVASTLMLLVVLIIGGTLLENNKKMNSLEDALSNITATLNNKNQVADNEDDTKVADGKTPNGVSTSNDDKASNDVLGSDNTKGTDDAKGSEDTTESKDTTAKDTTESKDTTVSKDTGAIDNSEEGATGKSGMEVETISSGIVVDNNEGANNGANIDNVVDDILKDDIDKEPVEVKPTKVPEKVVKEDTKVTPEIKYYTVKDGESLAGIAYKLYNSANYIKVIKQLNGIEDENKIFVGQKLIVP